MLACQSHMLTCSRIHMSNWPLEDCQAEVGASEIMLPFLHGAAPAARPRYLFEVSCEHVQCLVDF